MWPKKHMPLMFAYLIILIQFSPKFANSKLIRPLLFVKYADGVVLNASAIFQVDHAWTCAALCRRSLVCSTFSTKWVTQTSDTGANNGGSYECRLAEDEFTWIPDPAASLYSESIGDVQGYTFGSDGLFYKSLSPLQGNYTVAKMQCLSVEEGILPVPYPIHHYNAMIGIPPLNGKQYYVGITRTSSHAVGRWTTEDGYVFSMSNRSIDPGLTVWAANTPDGSGDVGRTFTSGLLDDVSRNVIFQVSCRRGNPYRKSRINGKFSHP